MLGTATGAGACCVLDFLDYLLGAAGAGAAGAAGVVLAAGAGWAAGAGAGAVVFISLTMLSEPCLGPPRQNADATLKITRRAASVHVVFSITSVVLRTPIIWLDEAKSEARPPPLDS